MRQKVMVPTNGSSMILNASRASGSLSFGSRTISYAVFCLKKKKRIANRGIFSMLGLALRVRKSHTTIAHLVLRSRLRAFIPVSEYGTVRAIYEHTHLWVSAVSTMGLVRP